MVETTQLCLADMGCDVIFFGIPSAQQYLVFLRQQTCESITFSNIHYPYAFFRFIDQARRTVPDEERLILDAPIVAVTKNSEVERDAGLIRPIDFCTVN